MGLNTLLILALVFAIMQGKMMLTKYNLNKTKKTLEDKSQYCTFFFFFPRENDPIHKVKFQKMFQQLKKTPTLQI